ncbi:MAG: DUF5683 domain-containing protein [Balneolales bacterium]|nr:DUF5683 domain-containing protein [Balneolales bacterium]
MKIFGLIVFICFASFSSFAQPVKQWSQTGISAAQEMQSSGTLETSFLPQNFNLENRINRNPFIEAPKNSPGIAMLASGVLPGSGQAMNGKWGRAAVYFAVEVVSIAYYFNQNNLAKENEEAYEAYGNQKWSVLAYAQWLVDYSEANGIDNGYELLANQLNQLAANDQTPNFGNTTDDWRKVDLNTLRGIEERTPFFFSNGRLGSTFSHVVQNYGSQQYYELMSKYYQFQPGWQDFHENRLSEGAGHVYQYTWNSSMITADFIEGRDRAQEFNQNYRNAGNILMLLMVNHVVSAFDAYFTVKLKNSRIQAQANMMSYTNSVSVSWHF